MVAPFGHIAMGLLFALPAWLLWDGRISVAFTGFVVLTSLLPDLDYYPARYLQGLHHHGVMHTVTFVVVVGILLGWVVTTAADGVVKRWWATAEPGWLSTLEVYVFTTGGFILGGLSHLFADMLSAPDGSQRIEPLWPVLDTPIGVDVIYYSDPLWNIGLLLVAIALHLVLAYSDAGPAWFAEPPGPSG